MRNEDFQYTESDVETALHFLSVHTPQFATPENAVKLLVYIHEQTKEIEDTSPEELEDLFQNLEER